MKFIILLSVIFIFYGCGSNAYPEEKKYVLHEAENVALSDFYRRITGYDSVEMIYFQGKWEANFCYPNKWEFNKFKIDIMGVDTVVFYNPIIRTWKQKDKK